MSRTSYEGPDPPLWYKDAVIYQLHVRSFLDSSGDGVGDFKGLTRKIDYLKDLGVDTLWLLPFYPSPLRDDGYDISNYTDIHPMYGTRADFRRFLHEAHDRGLRVITELILNHTSDQHAWFRRARRAPRGSRHRDYYVWSETPERYKDARIIFKDFETSNWSWDPVARAYYWHRFYSHQPDLNYDNPAVRRAILKVMDFWLDMGVDGLRLDGIPYLYERDGTSCENLPETHAFLRELRRHVDARYRNRLLLAEANQWPEDAVAYFGQGDECHMAFNFPIMPRMFMAVHMEDRFPLLDILAQTPPIPDPCQWVLFLRNHDELTLEMVTDEERDYMYRVYAHDPRMRINLGIRRRLGPLLQNNRRKIELLNGLLFSLPGTPVIYYGDEIGMGDNIYLGDRNGVRTPMQWSADRNAGFSRATPQKLYLPVCIDPDSHYEAINVDAQQNNPHSLLWWMKRLISLSRRHKAFGRGRMEILSPENRRIFAFLRQYENETILVVTNLSRFVQCAELDLSRFKGWTPVELFGRTEFPRVGEAPYVFTLGPHAFYWFLLEPARTAKVEVSATASGRTIEVHGEWKAVFRGHARAALEEALAPFLAGKRWYAGKGRQLRAVRLLDFVSLHQEGPQAVFAMFHADYIEGDRQVYSLPLAFASGRRAEQICRDMPEEVVAFLRVHGRQGELVGVLYDAVHDPAFCNAIPGGIERRRQHGGDGSRVFMLPAPPCRSIRGDGDRPLPAMPVRGEQSHSSVTFGDRFIMKFLRKVEPGLNPELEIGHFLTEHARFPASPPVAGHIEYCRENEEPVILGILSGFVANQGDAWTFTLGELDRYFEAVLSRATPLLPDAVPKGPLLKLIEGTPPAGFRDMVGAYLEMARLLGRRTAELHAALASAPGIPDLAPEPFTPFYQREVYQSMRSRLNRVMPVLRKKLKDLPEPAHSDARIVLEKEGEILKRFKTVSTVKISADRIRIHGDFHLGQLLYTGKDFVFLDFEGEPERPLGERRLKRSPLRDVAGMLRSFDYAAQTALLQYQAEGQVPQDRMASLEIGARLWQAWVCSAFLRAYLDRSGAAQHLPASRETLGILLDAFVLEKGLYELGYEFNHRPDWVRIPLKGLLHILDSKSTP